ncbi:MAG: alpha-amylase family glycosyl hydrolase [Pseudomonadales bacterium]
MILQADDPPEPGAGVPPPEPGAGVPWWQDAVFYQIYPRSFADGNGDGIGDLPGICERLDYLAWLGVDAIWISPFFCSPMKDFGYDVSDYCDVDPRFGTLADFDALVAKAHHLGIRVMIDWVPAHTSSEHPWFLEARASRHSAKRDWYVWRDRPADGGMPNNWRAAFTHGPAWAWDETTEQFWLHSFLPEQPDLNWDNPAVVAAMHQVLRFWLDRGVDGFRADVVHNIGKDPALPDVEPRLSHIAHCGLNDDPRTHAHLREIRTLLDGYPGNRTMVGEVYLLDTTRVAPYYGTADQPELHMSFNFPPLFETWSSAGWRQRIDVTWAVMDPRDAWPTWVLSNHDVIRHRTRYGSEARARAAALLLLGLRGTPFLYMGEELGLENALVPAERVVDPGGRDGCRAPLPWTAEAPHGWGVDAWLPYPPDAEQRCVDLQRDDPLSMLALYRRLLQLRRDSAALRRGSFEWLETPDGVLAWRRIHGDDACLVVVAFEGNDQPINLAPFAGYVTAISSDGAGEGQPLPDRIEPDRALWLTRSSAAGPLG